MLPALGLLLLAAACGPSVTRNPVPTALVDEVQPLGLAGLRQWGDVVPEVEVEAILKQRAAALRALYADELAAGRKPQLEYLSISGGGQWGAFSAGVLKAWSESGTRPEFISVAGISTGAIIAPMAFLGPKYDYILEAVYTSLSTKDVLTTQVLTGITTGMSLADTTLLKEQIDKYYTQEILDEIAREYRRGRVLFVGTTNLDSSRPVIWNMTAIAASGHPDALELFRSLILASAAIPVAFPPALIPVVGPDGTVYDEMHVDGGATSQVTLSSPATANAVHQSAFLERRFDRRLWVLMNNDVIPANNPVRPRITGIGERAVSSLIRSSGIGDLYKLYLITQEVGGAFRVGWIPGDLPCPEPTETFDPVFMRCLFDEGQRLFREDRLWQDRPPFYGDTVTSASTKPPPPVPNPS